MTMGTTMHKGVQPSGTGLIVSDPTLEDLGHLRSPVADLLGTNNAPSGPQILDIHKFIEEIDVFSLNAATGMCSLSASERTELVRRHRVLSDYKTAHTRLLSFIHRLPMEIMAYIFLLSCPLPTEDDMTRELSLLPMSMSKAPALLTMVSRRWNSIAAKIPQLWSTLHITLPSNKMDVSDVTQHVQLWLERSCEQPLHIDLVVFYTEGSDNMTAALPAMTPLMLMLAQQSNRWRNVSLILPAAMLSSVFAKVKGRLPNLEYLSIGTNSGNPVPSDYDAFSDAPKLTSLKFWGDPSSNVHFPWSQLQVATIIDSQASALASILRMDHVRRYVIQDSQTMQHLHPVPTAPPREFLPSHKLTSLTAGEQDFIFFIDNVRLPALEDLGIWRHLGSPYAIYNLTHSPIFRWDSHSTGPFFSDGGHSLRKFKLINIPTTAAHFIALLEYMPMLDELFIRIDAPDYTLAGMIESEILQKMTLEAHSNGEESRELKMALCPQLQRLTMVGKFIFNGETLADMVASRFCRGDVAGTGGTYLKAVTIRHVGNASLDTMERFQELRAQGLDITVRKGRLQVPARGYNILEYFDHTRY